MLTTACAVPQVRRAGALAVAKAVADKPQLEMLDLDANEIPETAVDNIKVNSCMLDNQEALALLL